MNVVADKSNIPPPDKVRLDRFLDPFRNFAAKKPAGAIVLLIAAVVALVWANLPGLSEAYTDWLAMPVGIGIGSFALEKPLILWINDGLMAIFFFVVGLEIKREMMAGELASMRKAALPLAGALGGVLLPALIYVAINAGGPGAGGWGIPMATDIAFALGVLALLGDRVPIGLKVFLTALAIVDDIVAIAVIGIFYTEGVAVGTLGIGFGLLVLALIANRSGIRDPMIYFILGILVWLAFLKSGVHATLAAVLMAFTIPSRTSLNIDAFVKRVEHKLDAIQKDRSCTSTYLLNAHEHHVLEDVRCDLQSATPPLQRLEHALLPAVTFLVLPIFALANAGVALGGDSGVGLGSLMEPVGLGVALGLLIGKPLGILGLSWLAVKLKWADLPEGVNYGQLAAVGLLGGIGFTMALFIGGLAFTDAAMIDTAKVGILAASTVAGVAGFFLLRSQLPK